MSTPVSRDEFETLHARVEVVAGRVHDLANMVAAMKAVDQLREFEAKQTPAGPTWEMLKLIVGCALGLTSLVVAALLWILHLVGKL